MAAPIKIGILNDMAAGPPGPGDPEAWLRLAVDELAAQGRLDRDISFIHAYGLGLPSGSAAAVEHAFKNLAAQDVLMIVGPAIGDNAIIATPLAELYRLPTLNWAGSERARGTYMFHLQVGSHEDESLILARYLAARGVRSAGVIYDRTPIGRRHLRFFQDEAEILGIAVTAAAMAPLATDASEALNQLLGAGIEGLVYLGLGLAAPAVARCANQRGWHGPCAMNSAGLRGYAPDFAKDIDHWVYVDLHADNNMVLQDLCTRLDIPPARALAAAKGYDLGRLVAEGISRAPELTRDGIKKGLEHIKCLAAAEGQKGTLLGFGHYDRGALHGSYLVLRQWRDGVSVAI
jgi:ABC-type branched-subunit amino acid transport system substrate-binding protein